MWWFRKKSRPSTEVEIQPGDVFYLRPKPGDPFPDKITPVRVREVRNGWVRYRMEPMFPDLRLMQAEFLRLYRNAEHP